MTYHELKKRPDEAGLMTAFMLVILAFLFLVALSLLSYILTTKNVEKRSRGEVLAVQIAEAGIQKAMYCLNADTGDDCGGFYGAGYAGESTIDMGTGYFSSTITGSGTERTIISVGTTYAGFSQTVAVDITTVPPTDDTAFAYALQSGEGGAHLENNAEINGTLYSNGNVTCQTTQALVDGDIFVSLDDGYIDSCTANYHGYADKIFDSDILGDAYYENDPADIAGTIVGGTKYPGSTTPNYEPLPSIDLGFWRSTAAGGNNINGDYSPVDGESLGPAKITGNLIIDNNVNLNITGPIWVVGNITTGNNSSFTLDSSFGPYGTTILADDQNNKATKGRINITNNTGIYGSGHPSSHILFVATNNSQDYLDPALEVANNSAGAVFYATDGVLLLNNNATAKSLASHKLHVSQESEINYLESELADAKFSNGPSNRWRIVPGQWRQVK